MSIIIITLFYLSILLSIVGYGYLSSKILNIYTIPKDLMFFGFLGIISLTFLSYFTNLFVSHNFTHNLLLTIFGISGFLFALRKKNICKKSLIKLIFLAIFLIILSLLSKTHDDFSWYHLPYTLNIAQNKLQFGLGHFNHGFRTPSSLFYLNSIFYLPIIKFYSFNFAQLYIFLFGLIYFYKKIFDKNSSNFISIYSLLSFIFVIIVFYRLGEHGTDRSGQIILFLCTIFLFDILREKTLNHNKLKLFIVFFVYIVTIKTYFIIFTLLFLPLIFKYRFEIDFYKQVFFSKITFFSLIFLLLHFNIQLANTGCVLYPMSFTCFSDFIWSINKEEIIFMGEHYELWSKSGANPNFKIEDVSNYIKDFNWVQRWISEYFFTKVSDLVLGIIVILIVCFYSLRDKINDQRKSYNIEIYIISISLFITLIIWFTKFPQLRYGGYFILANLFFLPFCLYVFNSEINTKTFKKAKILITVSILIFTARNIDRMLFEIEFYNYQPLQNAYFRIENPSYEKKILSKDIILNKTSGSCWSIPQPCARSDRIKAKKFNNYVVYWRN